MCSILTRYKKYISCRCACHSPGGWETIISFWDTAYFQGRTASFREVTRTNLRQTQHQINDYKIICSPSWTGLRVIRCSLFQIHICIGRLKVGASAFISDPFPGSQKIAVTEIVFSQNTMVAVPVILGQQK